MQEGARRPGRPAFAAARRLRLYCMPMPVTVLLYEMAFEVALCRDVLAVFMRVIFGWLKDTDHGQG
jgi:hypothetical protein